jgi:hypothetical protein
MKKLSVLLALVALVIANAALAATAVVTSLTGNVQVQSGSAAARMLRQGDEVVQGDTVFTGRASSVVLKFDDGQVAALSANSRMQVTTYAYNPRLRTGNVLLSLVMGGMRAITGLIGHNQPNNVKFRAATATIGIRGSEGDIITDGVNAVSVIVLKGEFVFTYGSSTVNLPAGRGAFGADGKVTEGTVQEIYNRLPATFREHYNGLQDLANAINSAGPGVPRPLPDLLSRSVPATPGNNIPPGGNATGVVGTGGGPASNQ